MLSSPALIQNAFIGTNATGSSQAPQRCQRRAGQFQQQHDRRRPRGRQPRLRQYPRGIPITGSNNQVLANRSASMPSAPMRCPTPLASESLARRQHHRRLQQRYQQRHSGNTGDGVRISSPNNTATWDFIGITKSSVVLANGANGIHVTGSNNTLLGRSLSSPGTRAGRRARGQRLTTRIAHDLIGNQGGNGLGNGTGRRASSRPAPSTQPSAARPRRRQRDLRQQRPNGIQIRQRQRHPHQGNRSA